jgi:Na+/H+ antiporter NhaD/arsenite permease-like protein
MEETAKDLICRVCLLSAISSAFFTNDTSCMVLTEFVLNLKKKKSPTSTFVGCSCLKFKYWVISYSNWQPSKPGLQISSWPFLVETSPAALVGVLAIAILTLCMYWKKLSSHYRDEEYADGEIVADDDVSFYRFSPGTMSHFTCSSFQERSSRLDMQDLPFIHGNSAFFDMLRH